MNGILYEEDYVGLFLLVTVVMGGGAAWLAGRAIAATWRPWWHVAGYMLILGWRPLHPFRAVRRHAALAPILCGRHCRLPDFRLSRLPGDPRAQMTTQYGWINARAGFLRWRGARRNSGKGR